MNFFIQELNYSFANEDSFFERELSEIFESKSILAVCGSGLRGLLLVNSHKQNLDLIDISKDQLAWANLRLKSFGLNEDEYKKFWLEKQDPQTLKDTLSDIDNNQMYEFFASNDWMEPLYYGRWEKTFLKLNRIVKFIFGKKRLNELEHCQNIQEQIEFFEKNRLRWYFILTIVGNKSLFNRLMYKGQFVKKNIAQSYVQFYYNAYKKLTANVLLKDSFFLQLTFLGEVRNSTHISADFTSYKQLQNQLKTTEINFIQQDILNYAEVSNKIYNLVSYSDVPSYYDEHMGNDFLQTIKPIVAIKGIVVVRYYLRVHQPDLAGYKDITDSFQDQIDKEMVQMYFIKIYQRVE